MHQNHARPTLQLISPTVPQPFKPWHAQGELFERLKLQPLPLFKAGPEDEATATRH